ncbi:MAG: tetratricopeptide repeat protein [Acetobacteraceae bacterium]|jgi:tetratricopeptide (TPR) repeat protein
MIWPFGDGPIGAWLERHRALRDMQRAAAIDEATLSLRDDNPLHRAKVSLEVDDLKSAREFLDIARARIPNYVLTCPDTVDILLGLGDFAELEAFALKGAKRFPKQPHYLEGYAMVAETQRNFDEAVRRWAVVRKKFPRSTLAYTAAIGSLRHLGRLDEAEALLRSALRMMPGDMTVLLEWGRVAEARGDWEEAHRRWDSLRDRHPQGFWSAAWALQRLGRTAEAEALLEAGRLRFPTSQGIAIMQAQIAKDAGNIAEALRRWGVVRQRFPFDPAGYVEAIRLLRPQGAWEEADAIALAAIERFHAHAWPLADYAMLAHDRQDWPEAAKRWAALRAAFPDHKDARDREAEALAAAGLPPAGGVAEPVTSRPSAPG